MDAYTEILKQLQSIIDASPATIWLKIAFMILMGGVGILVYFNKKKMRKHAADTNQNRDRDRNIRDNTAIETQSSTDGGSVRDRIRRGEP